MSEALTKSLPLSEGEKLTQILSTVLHLDSRVERLDSRVERLDSTVVRLDSQLETLEQRVEERLFDTRPIWEKVNVDIAEVQAGQLRLAEGQLRLEEGLEFLRGETREIRTLLRDIFRRLSIFNDTLVTMQADYRDIYDRLREIERQR